MKVLVAGGAGYIGSMVTSALVDAGHTPVVLDDLSTGHRACVSDVHFYLGDIADVHLVERIFAAHPDIESCIDLAARIVVPESISDPLRYYTCNVGKTMRFVETVAAAGCRRIVFSSSAAVYGSGETVLVSELSPLDPHSPYARTKLICEWFLADLARTGAVRAISLRYFNPVGADPWLRRGVSPVGPTHVLSKLVEADLRFDTFVIAGDDWPTRDGTCIRDYAHVWDIARAHVCAVERFEAVVDNSRPSVVINLGTGVGVTVKELVATYREVARADLRVEVGPRRPGDTAGCISRGDLAAELLGWRPELTLQAAIRHTLAWARHPSRA